MKSRTMTPARRQQGSALLLDPRSLKGSALLITLAFILLLTIIVTAFLSKSLLEKTVSNASADQTRTDVFAQGAVDAILSDCQQEIAAGSTITTNTISSVNYYTYTPSYPQTVVPSRTWTNAVITTPNPLPNLVKRSACGLTFYTNYSGAYYPNAATYPAVESTISSDPNHYDSTTMPSLNGRYYSTVRWNKSLLLPRQTMSSSTDYTPTNNFTAPDWILVQRDGTYPTSWSPNLCVSAPNDVTITNKNPVVGRYAYLIYDEGGLLDMNVAGFPTNAVPATATGGTQKYYRTSLASVDLTQLAATNGGTPFFTQNDVNLLTGWRNYATLQASGTMQSGYTFPASDTNYFNNVQQPGIGFLHTTVPSSVSSVTVGKTDRKFTSRQQLIDLLLNDVAQSTTEQANLMNGLQYLGTFSRDLSQPSYEPNVNRPRMQANSSTVSFATNSYSATAPGATYTDWALNGGNDSASDDGSSGNSNINVPFPATLVQTSFTRNDGSTANVGDPLVKKRFALNRLAWLTYQGPSADRSAVINNNPSSTAGNSDYDIYQLQNNYGVSNAFLMQGTDANIKAYFGLTWAADSNDNGRKKWYYNVHNNSAGIRELGGASGIAASSPHDPDFFELLKAGILAGSKGKALATLTGINTASPNLNITDAAHPYVQQNLNDVSLDYQILQIGANIIDQSRLDGYTTEIVFSNNHGNGANTIEVRGVENYPYLYRVRMGALALRQAALQAPDPANKATASPVCNKANYAITDTGVAALMEIPEIWNPHDVNSPMGTLYPTQFRLVVDSTSPANLDPNPTSASLYSNIYAQGDDSTALLPSVNPSSSAATSATPVFSITAGGSTAITPANAATAQPLTPANTALTFTVPSADLGMFREPTMLARSKVPAGSNLAMATPPGNWTSIVNSTAGNSTTSWTGTGFLSDPNVTNPLNLPSGDYTASTPYVGIVLGLYPVQWVYDTNLPNSAANDYIYVSQSASPLGTLNTYLTYRMQYLDASGAWATYDEKYIAPASRYVVTPFAVGTNKTTTGLLVNNNTASATPGYYQSGAWENFADPRTSRWGVPGGANDQVSTLSTPGSYSSEWLDGNNGVLMDDRPDYNQGFAFEDYANRSGLTYKFGSDLVPGWICTPNTYAWIFWGPFSQNTVSTTTQGSGHRYVGDTSTSFTFNPFYYADPDGVVRRAMGGDVPNTSTANANNFYFGLPMATATYNKLLYSNTTVDSATSTIPSYGAVNTQSTSRPYMLKRPFRSVAELGYVFSGTPWKNLDFFNPESGDSPLLDVFCINDTDDPNGLVAGKVSLNTQQVPVLAAILANAYYDDLMPSTVTSTATKYSSGYIGGSGAQDYASANQGYGNGAASAYTQAPFYLASLLVNGPQAALGSGLTTALGQSGSTTGTSVTPLMNASELVGKWVGTTTTSPIDGTSINNFAGYSSDLGIFYNPNGTLGASFYGSFVQRYHEAAVRALSAVGQTRVWNLMIDVVAQTGRYPSTATNASNFVVEGERRYWVHVAIDRFTGKILDRQIEEVRQ